MLSAANPQTFWQIRDERELSPEASQTSIFEVALSRRNEGGGIGVTSDITDKGAGCFEKTSRCPERSTTMWILHCSSEWSCRSHYKTCTKHTKPQYNCGSRLLMQHKRVFGMTLQYTQGQWYWNQRNEGILQIHLQKIFPPATALLHTNVTCLLNCILSRED